MKIGYGNFWIEIEPTIGQVKSIFESIWRILSMNIPLWLIVLILIAIYIIIWRQRVCNWEIKHSMFRLWSQIYSLKVMDFRNKGISDKDIESYTTELRWEEMFYWKRPKMNKPRLLPKFRRGKKNATS